MIFVIHPFKEQGIWKFTDPSRSITNEPFVGDINDMIDLMTAGMWRPEKGFTAYFSADRFPQAAYRFKKVRNECGGATYTFRGFEGWLCPCLLKFFMIPPENIYIHVTPAKSEQIANLTRDKERLDWLDTEQSLCEAQDSNYRWQSWEVTAENTMPSMSVREAIDAARRGE